MNQQMLRWLSYSSSLAILLLFPGLASANAAPLEIEFVSPALLHTPTILDQFGQADAAEPKLTGLPSCVCGDLDAAQVADREGMLAIENLGCDCAGCRMFIRQQLAAGRLVL
jgi:hypothetical protein